MFVLIVAVACVGLVSSSSVPITKCKLGDSECIKQNTKVLVPLFGAGIPELGIEQLDPVFFKKIDSSNDFLTLVFKDVTVKGLSGCRFKKIEHNLAKEMLTAKIHCNVVLDAQYQMKGAILAIQFTGEGKSHIEHEKIEITFDLGVKEETGADGKTHWKTGSWKHDFKYLGKNVLEFDNLFGGNEVLASTSKQLLKEHPKELSELTAGPVIKVIVARILKNIKIFFEKTPIEDFILA